LEGIELYKPLRAQEAFVIYLLKLEALYLERNSGEWKKLPLVI